jgi:hypothetical protein
MAYRFDAGRLGKAERTPQGGARVAATLTRAGVLTYRNPDGTTRKELRPPDEVFRTDSLATLRGAPVTIGHVALVTPANFRELVRGHVSDEVRRDGAFVTSSLMLQDDEALTRIDAGELVELSAGYTLDYLPEPGTYKGERYDGVQRNVRYNHVALLPAGGGRAGRDVGLRLDSASAACDDWPSELGALIEVPGVEPVFIV